MDYAGVMRTLAATILFSLLTYGQSSPVASRQTTIPPEVFETLIAKRVSPKLSKEAKRLNADLVVSIEIDETGKLQRFDFVSGPIEFREPTAKALPEWKFRPYVSAGVAVPVKSELLLGFGVGSQAGTFGIPFVEKNDAKRLMRSQVPPRYPQVAKISKIQGTVTVKVLVSEQGRVADAAAISGPDMLRGASIDAVRLWTFEPLIRNGVITPFETDIDVTYSIQ